MLSLAVNLGYAIVGILGTVLVRNLGRDWLSYVISLSSFLWYFLWWRFVEESLHPNRPKRDVSFFYCNYQKLFLYIAGTQESSMA